MKLNKFINGFLDALAGLVLILIFIPVAFFWYMLETVYRSTKRIFVGESGSGC